MTNNVEITPIAKACTLKDLTGWFGKWFHVPTDRQGIILRSDGSFQLFPPGKRPVIRPFEKYLSSGLNLRIGYIPNKPFELGARYENLFCGDEELLDLSLVYHLEVIQPEVFFSKLVVPIGELVEFPHLSTLPIHELIQNVIKNYEREDILNKKQPDSIAKEISKEIMNLFPAIGLRLLGIPLILFSRSEDRLMVEDKLAELESTLKKTEANPKGNGSGGSINQIAKTVFPGAINLSTEETRPLSDVIKSLSDVRRMKKLPKRHWLLSSLSNDSVEENDSKTLSVIKKWQRLEINWIILLLLIGAILSYFVYRFDFNLKDSAVIGFLVGVWGLIVSFILNSLKKLVEKKEKILLKNSLYAGLESSTNIDFEDRLEVDKLVRQNCANEMIRAKEILNKCRDVIYRSGNTDLALKIKGLESELEEKKDQFITSSYAKPFFLSQMMISDSDWKRILDQEELVLKQAKNIGMMAESIQLALPQVDDEDFQKFQQQLVVLEGSFFNRSRVN